MDCQAPIIEPSPLSVLTYKRKRRRREKELEEILVKLFVKNSLSNTRTVEVGYYLKEGRTTSKLLIFYLFSATFFLFIAAPPSRGADHGVSSNSTPTIVIHLMTFVF